MKKICLNIFTVLMLLSLNASAVFAQSSSGEVINELVYEQKFTDVGRADVEILYLNELGIIGGNPDNTMKSNAPLNRAEAVTIFARFFSLDPVYDPDCTFYDVDPNVWFAGYVSSLCNADLIRGYPDGSFGAMNQLNRAEAFAIFVRGLEMESELAATAATNLQSDVPAGVWYAPYAQFAKNHNLFDGAQTFFKGENNYTRGDVFENLYRYLRITELGEQVYDTFMDPAIVSSLEGKSDDVTFYVEPAKSNYSSYFNALKDRDIKVENMDLSGSYKNIAYRIVGVYFTESLQRNMSYKFDTVINNIRRIDDFSDEKVEPYIMAFYQTFGVEISDINAVADQSDIDSIVEQIIALENNYSTPSGDVRMSFISDSERSASLYFSGYCNPDSMWFEGEDPQQDGAFEAGSYELRHQDIRIKDSSGKELDIEDITSDCQPVRVKNEQGIEETIDYLAFYSVELEEPFEEGEKYTMEVGPTLVSVVLDSNGATTGGLYVGGLGNRDVVIPAMSVDFVRDSAKEYTYQGEGETELAGVAILGDVLYTWPSAELYAVPYGKNLSPKDFHHTEMHWTVLSGDARVENDGERNKIYFNSVGEILLEVEYKGFFDTRVVHFDGSQSV